MAKFIFSQEELERMEAQLWRLTDKEKLIFTLFHRRGRNIEEIAAALEVNRSTVDRRLRSARNKLLPYK